ncbi:MAG: RagB/SusD family nutrient uptake outer membrane protein [Chitinophagaceae bacterium]|nr:RagB/SusD family nutrient uptake outer membrane protein [Chitinophagaceae bacterium]
MKSLSKFITVIAITCLAVSCKKPLDEQAYTFVSGEDLIRTGNYKELVAGAYNTMSFPFEWGNYHNIVNFDVDYQSGPNWAFGEIGAGNFYENGSNRSFYQSYYQAIHRANYHSYLVSQMNVPEDEKNNAIGELKFLKAWAYFNLVQFYGDLVLYTTSVSEGAPLYKPRSPIKDVYAHIIEELKIAETSMYSTHSSKYQKGHPSSGAAKALLAKVYCTIGSASMATGAPISVMGGIAFYYDDNGNKVRVPYPVKQNFAKNQVAGYESFDSKEYYRLGMEKAKELIELNDFDLYGSQSELWAPASKNGKEFIFTLQTIAGNAALSNFVATDYCGYYMPSGQLQSGYYVQRDHWYQLFDDGDERITWGVMHRVPFTYDANTNTLYYSYYPAKDSVKVRLGLDGYKPTDQLRYDAHLYGSKLMKFRQVSNALDGNRTDFNFPFMRYAEVLLLYAEADNEVNGLPSAYAIQQVDKLNARNKAVLAATMGTNTPWTQESFRSYILQERAKEFAAEGIRRFDLLRWGIYLQTMNALGGTDENGVIKRREQRHLLLPLPADEVNTNPFIEANNPGW